MLKQKCVDVAINVYGKPYLTAVTILSLMKQSGQWINKLYLVEERQQPPGTDLGILKELVKPFDVVHYRPWFFLGVNNLLVGRRRHFMPFTPYRHSIRYQYAWEKTKKPYLFITHNDVLYSKDLVGAYLSNIGEAIGIGKVGQCWNCPAFKEKVCDGNRYLTYRPTKEELDYLYEKQGDARNGNHIRQTEMRGPWPLPECRLNEYACLVDMTKARPVTSPKGAAHPFGLHGYIDVNVDWFSDVNHMGFKVANLDYDAYASHSWVNALNNGHRALSDKTIYDAEEKQAYDLLRQEFGFKGKWSV